MDSLSTLKSDNIRSVLTLLIPGSVSLAPWCVILWHYRPTLLQFALDHSVFSGFIFLLAALWAGKTLDDMGTWWETHFNDTRLKKKAEFSSFEGDWDFYLCTVYEHEPVGLRYIHDMVMALKFEINQGLSLIIAGIGSIFCFVLKTGFCWYHILIFYLLLSFLIVLFLYNSYCTSIVLARTRKKLRKCSECSEDESS